MEKLALWVTSRTQRGSLPFYQSVVYLVLVAGLGLAIITNDTWNIEFDLFNTPLDFIVAAVLIVVAVAATRAKKRFTAVVVTGISGYAMVAYFAFVGAPDLALTQVLVETITIVVFVLVLRRLPARIGQSTGRFTPAWRAIIGGGVGVTMMLVVLIAAGARVSEPVSVDFGQLAYEMGHGKNIVNVTSSTSVSGTPRGALRPRRGRHRNRRTDLRPRPRRTPPPVRLPPRRHRTAGAGTLPTGPRRDQ